MLRCNVDNSTARSRFCQSNMWIYLKLVLCVRSHSLSSSLLTVAFPPQRFRILWKLSKKEALTCIQYCLMAVLYIRQHWLIMSGRSAARAERRNRNALTAIFQKNEWEMSDHHEGKMVGPSLGPSQKRHTAPCFCRDAIRQKRIQG